jgi:hypothetical protein
VSDTASPASRARKERLFSDEDLEVALRKHLGIHSGAAKALGCSRRAVSKRIEADPDKWKPIVAEAREGLLDIAESVLVTSMRQTADPKVRLDSAKYALTCLGKARGYSPKQEHTVDVRGLAFDFVDDE